MLYLCDGLQAFKQGHCLRVRRAANPPGTAIDVNTDRQKPSRRNWPQTLKNRPVVFQRNGVKVALKRLFAKAKLCQGLSEDLLLRELRTAIR